MSTIIEQVPQGQGDLNFYGGNLEAFLAKEREIFLCGSSDTGKTFSLCTLMHMFLVKYPGAKALFCRKSQTALRATGVKTYQTILQKTGFSDKVRVMGESRPTHFIYPRDEKEWNGRVYRGVSEITLSPIDSTSNALGAEYDFVFVSQPDTGGLTLEEYQLVSSRANGRAGNAPYPRVVADPNPSYENHWIKIGADEGRWRLINSYFQDNPTLYDHANGVWRPEGLKRIEVLSNLSGTDRERLYEGKWFSTEGMAFAEYFNRNGEHTFTWDSEIAHQLFPQGKIPHEWQHYLAIDWGFDDAFVALLIAKHPVYDLYILHKHIYITFKDINETAPMTRDMVQGYNIKAIIADRNPDNVSVMEKALGRNITIAKKGAGSVQTSMNTAIGELKLPYRWLFLNTEDSLQHEPDPRLIELKKPYGLIEELPNLKKDGKTGNIADKQPDHAYDAYKYFCSWLAQDSGPKKKQVAWI